MLTGEKIKDINMAKDKKPKIYKIVRAKIEVNVKRLESKLKPKLLRHYKEEYEKAKIQKARKKAKENGRRELKSINLFGKMSEYDLMRKKLKEKAERLKQKKLKVLNPYQTLNRGYKFIDLGPDPYLCEPTQK